MKHLRWLLPVCLAVVPFAFGAEDPSPEHVKLMKELGALSGKIRKGEDVEESAKRMSALGQSAMGFYAKKGDVATTALKNMVTASNMIASAAANKDTAVLADASKMLGSTCKSCHDQYREKVSDGVYKIK